MMVHEQQASDERETHNGGAANVKRYAAARILVVDDHKGIRTLIRKIVLVRLGCEVVLASSGEEALDKMAHAPFEVIITDMVMPGMHGIELIKRTRCAFPEVDIIVMTGYASEFPYVEVIKAGANDFINKPFPSLELEAKLVRLLEERRLRREHRMAQSKYRNLFERSMDGMVLIERDGHFITDANQAFCEMTGRNEEALASLSIAELMGEECSARFEHLLEVCALRGNGSMNDLTLFRPGGEEMVVDVSITFINEQPQEAIFLTFKDVTEKREIDRKLADAAQRDELTGLYNKRSFQNRIEWAVSQALQKESDFTLLAMDLDNFKACNDNYGHQVGDKILAAVGKVIRESVRADNADEGFRVGGDEFFVILHGARNKGSRLVAERMHEKFSRVEAFGATMSIGIAEYKRPMQPSELIGQADAALYKAKAKGKNTIHFA